MGDVGELDPMSRGTLERDRSVACVVQLNAVPLRDGSFTFGALSSDAASRARSTPIGRLPSSMLAIALRSRVEEQQPEQRASAPAIQCPMAKPSGNDDQLSVYLERFNKRWSQQCDPTGMGMGEWGLFSKCTQFCKVISVGALMQYLPGELVFDWGAGCGHALGWLRRAFGVAATGHEFHGVVGAKAVQHAGAEAMCDGDGADLSHLPDEYVDHVISNGAVYHLSESLQVRLIPTQMCTYSYACIHQSSHICTTLHCMPPHCTPSPLHWQHSVCSTTCNACSLLRLLKCMHACVGGHAHQCVCLMQIIILSLTTCSES